MKRSRVSYDEASRIIETIEQSVHTGTGPALKVTPVTTLLSQELLRVQEALRQYEAHPGEGTVTGSQYHAALFRATMDLSRMLVRWRSHSAGARAPGCPK